MKSLTVGLRISGPPLCLALAVLMLGCGGPQGTNSSDVEAQVDALVKQKVEEALAKERAGQRTSRREYEEYDIEQIVRRLKAEEEAKARIEAEKRAKVRAWEIAAFPNIKKAVEAKWGGANNFQVHFPRFFTDRSLVDGSDVPAATGSYSFSRTPEGYIQTKLDGYTVTLNHAGQVVNVVVVPPSIIP